MSAFDQLCAARDAVEDEMVAGGGDAVNALLDAHAHYLAERLRARSMEIAGYDDAYRHAADFIDPEVD